MRHSVVEDRREGRIFGSEMITLGWEDEAGDWSGGEGWEREFGGVKRQMIGQRS